MGRSKRIIGVMKEQLPQNSEAIANDMRFVAAFSVWMAHVERSTGQPEEGRFENDAEHAYSLSKVALLIAWKYFPNLDVGLVAIYANIHDDLEGYTGDTPTLGASAQVMAQKRAAEESALPRISEDFKEHPKYLEHLYAYERQDDPESRYVRILDKCMPSLLNLINGGWSLRSQHGIETSDELKKQYIETTQRYLDEGYGEDWSIIIQVRDCLTTMMAMELFNGDSNK